MKTYNSNKKPLPIDDDLEELNNGVIMSEARPEKANTRAGVERLQVALTVNHIIKEGVSFPYKWEEIIK